MPRAVIYGMDSIRELKKYVFLIEMLFEMFFSILVLKYRFLFQILLKSDGFERWGRSEQVARSGRD